MCLQRRHENTLAAAGKDAWFPTDVLGVLASFNGPFWNVDRDISVRVTVRLKVFTCRAVRIFTTLRENNQKYQQMLTSHHLQRPRRFWSGRQGLVGSQSHSFQERQFSFSFRNNQARLSPHSTRWWQQTAANSRELYLAGGSRLTGNGSLRFFGKDGQGRTGFRIQISWLLFVRNKSARLWACAGCLGSFREASASSMESKQHVSQQKNHIWRAGSGQVKQSSMIYVDSKFQYEWQVGLARVQGAMPSFGLVLPEH